MKYIVIRINDLRRAISCSVTRQITIKDLETGWYRGLCERIVGLFVDFDYGLTLNDKSCSKVWLMGVLEFLEIYGYCYSWWAKVQIFRYMKDK